MALTDEYDRPVRFTVEHEGQTFTRKSQHHFSHAVLVTFKPNSWRPEPLTEVRWCGTLALAEKKASAYRGSSNVQAVAVVPASIQE